MSDSDCAHCQIAGKQGPKIRSVAGGAEWHLFHRADKRFAWHLIGANGHDIIATDGGQGYESAQDAAEIMLKLKGGTYSSAPVEPKPRPK